MFKKILLILFILFNLFIKVEVFADSIPVKNIFSDINSDYKYLDELQTLYDKGMVFPDEEGKFNPYELLTREDFVGITMEVSCKKCIKPNVDYYFIDKYKTKPFYDVELDNKNFYCIADASENNYINGYDESYVCDNGTTLEGQKPFCTKNNIVLEEALAIILRVSGILTNKQAQEIRDDIYNGIITENLSDDVFPKNLDGSVYSFYPDFMKALEYEIVDYDKDGNKKIYHLVEVIDGKLRPKKNITKEEFLHIAYVALKANNCLEIDDSNLGLQINIYDSSCNETLNNCKLTKLSSNNTYDFDADAYTTAKNGIDNPEGYIWRFYNQQTGEEYIKYGKYIDDYKLENPGTRDIFLRVIDSDGNTSEVKSTINVTNNDNQNDSNNDLLVSIKADPIYGLSPLKINLEGVVEGASGDYSYEWDFGDGTSGFGKDQEIIYKTPGIYEVKLIVTDSDGNIVTSSIFIDVNDTDILNNNLNYDSDGDGINDLNDNCPLIDGEKQNNGCPIFTNTCVNNNDCKDGYYCKIDQNNFGICELIQTNISNSLCNYNGGSIISGNIICESCPCSNFLDYISVLRKCDIIFPAITSPDNSIIYSKGDYYQIK